MENANGTKKVKSKMRVFLGVASVLGFFGPLSYIMVKGLASLSAETALLFGNMMGVSMMLIKETYSYYFGGSQMIEDAAETSRPLM